MAKRVRPKTSKTKKKGKIKLSSSARLVEKNDATRVARRDTLKKAPVKTVLPTNGITFKVKIRKK